MFAFMERYGAEALLRDFRRPIERIVGSIGQLEEFTGAAAASRNVVFLVGCSLSGGTGGGLFMDVMRLIAHEGSTQLGGTPFVIVPLVLLPSAFDNVLAPSKRKNGSLNAIRALADLGQLIDAQNAPTAEGEPPTYEYPGGSAGTGSLRVVHAGRGREDGVPVPPTRGRAERQRAGRARRAVRHQPRPPALDLEPRLGAAGVRADDDAAGQAREQLGAAPGAPPHVRRPAPVRERGDRRRPRRARAARPPRVQAAPGDVPDRRADGASTTTTRTRRMELFQERAGVQPPLLAPIDGRYRTAVIQPISTEPEDVSSAMQAYQAAIRQVMISPSTKKDGGVPDNLSAGAATAFERAASARRPRRPVGHARPAHVEHHGPRPGRRDGRRPRDVRALGGGPAGRARRSARAGRSSSSRPRRRWSSTSAACSAAASRRSIRAPSARSGRPRSRRSTPPGAPTSPTPRAPRSSSAPPAGRFGPGWTRRSAASTSGARARPTTRSSTRRPASSSGSRPA